MKARFRVWKRAFFIEIVNPVQFVNDHYFYSRI